MKHPPPASSGTPGKTIRKTPARAKTRSDSPPPVAPEDGQRDELIRQTAYAFYVARGCIAGCELDDWLQAEAHVSQVLASPAPASPPSPSEVQAA